MTTDIGPIRKSVVVNVPQAEAFALFIDKFDAIKTARTQLAGSRCHWARVLIFAPPNRVVFSWDIGPTWQLEQDLSKTSEVEVRFIADSPARTRVELEHRHLERHGEGWRAVAGGVDGDAGWPLYLRRFSEVAAEVAS